MDNYLFTCLKSDQQNPDGSDMFRYRMRRDPGFHLMKEAHAYRCENHRWYAFQYLIRKGEVGVCIDRLPHEAYTWLDPQPLAEATSASARFRATWNSATLRCGRWGSSCHACLTGTSESYWNLLAAPGFLV